MKCHMIINGFLPDIEKQWKELSYFREHFAAEVTLKSTIIICPLTLEKKRLQKMAPTPEILFLECTFYHPEVVLKMLVNEMNQEDLYLFGYAYSGCECAVRAAARTGGSASVAVQEAAVHTQGLIARKMVYSNNMQGEFLLRKPPFCISIANGLKEQEIIPYGISEMRIVESKITPSHIQSCEIQQQVSGEVLESAEKLVVAGRGIARKEEITLLEDLAESIQGFLGISRPVAMNGWAPMEKLIGVSGTMAKPKLCITVGVSGAAAFYAGIEKGEFIVAVNNDKGAPIIKKADVAIIDDCIEVVRALAVYVNKHHEDKNDEK